LKGGRTVNDQSGLLDDLGLGQGDTAFDVSATPTPLLKDLGFAIVDEKDSDDPSGSSGENAAIDRLLENDAVD
jgi:hypothetical protein